MAHPAEAEPLILANLGLVHAIVRDSLLRLPANVRRDELTSAGMLGLVLAARSYDPSRGVPFARWVAIRINGAILDELRSMDWASRSVRAKARDVEAARNQLTVSMGHSPRPEDVAAAVGMSVAELAELDADVHRASLLSIQAFAPELAADLVPDAERGPEQTVVDHEQLAELRTAVADLPSELHYVVQATYLDEQTIAPVAAELGVTESRVSQLRTQAVRLLRKSIAA